MLPLGCGRPATPAPSASSYSAQLAEPGASSAYLRRFHYHSLALLQSLTDRHPEIIAVTQLHRPLLHSRVGHNPDRWLVETAVQRLLWHYEERPGT